MSAEMIGKRVDVYLSQIGSWFSSREGLTVVIVLGCLFVVIQAYRALVTWCGLWRDLYDRAKAPQTPATPSVPVSTIQPPRITADALARLADLCIDVAECIEGMDDRTSAPAPSARPPRPRVDTSFVPARSVETAELLADLSEEFGNKPGFVSATYDGQSISILSRFDVWETELHSWMAEHAPDMPYDFKIDTPIKSKPIRMQHRCPKCQSLRMIPVHDPPSKSGAMVCQSCFHVFPREQSKTNRPAPSPNDPRFKTALGALEALSGDPSASNQTFAVQTRPTDDEPMAG